jgi:hypothetical protein
MDSISIELIKLEIDNLSLIPILTATFFYLARSGWIKIVNLKNKYDKRLNSLPEIIFPLNKFNLLEDPVVLFKKSFICPVTRELLKSPYLVSNGFSNNFEKNNLVDRLYYNRNLEKIVKHIIENKSIFENNEKILEMIK